MTTYSFSTLLNNQSIAFDPLHDVLYFDTGIRPAELLINGTASGVQFSAGSKSIVLANISLDDLGISSATAARNVTFSSPGVLLVGEGTTGHDGDLANLITGGAGDDALVGLGGDDTLNGGAGGDLMVGGLGNDLYRVDNVADVVTEENNSLPGAGNDTVEASVSYTLTNYVENLTLVGTGNIAGTGNTLNNILLGNSGDNILDGKTGGDTMTGGNGNDTYVVDSANDRVIETNSSATQIDTVMSSISYGLGANLEDLVLTGLMSTVGVGNHRDNHITGNMAANTLNGGYGADTMTGGDGNDIYIVDNAGDQVVETSNSLSQIDTVASFISYTLGTNLENVRLLGSADIDATGNALNNVLYANAGNNVLDGQAGNDTASYASLNILGMVKGSPTTTTVTSSVSTAGVTVDLNITGYQDTQGSGFDKLIGIENLTGSNYNDELTGNAGANILDGGAGADVLTGGKGNDTYYVDGADVVVELNGALDGLDIVYSSVSYRLTANVEYLTLLPGSAVSAIGNNLDNRLVGNSAANFLDGRAGADKMDGGSGNDTYVVDNLGDEITDYSGTDLVMTYINYTLGSTLENLRLMGTNALNGTGNALNNIIWMNIGDNVVDGGGDTLVGGVRGDTVSYEYGATSGITLDLSKTGPQATGGSGTDTIINVEHVIGSNYNDLLSGNDGANILDGGWGVDTVSYANAAAGVVIDLTAQTAVVGGVIDLVRNFENVTGSSFDDTMTGDLGANSFNGGSGIDSVTYQNVAAGEGGVNVSLAIVGAQNTLASGWDTFISVPKQTRSSIENLTGSVNEDTLTGDAYANRLDGSDGNDILRGAGGNDALIGGAGDDLIDGGNGKDRVIFVGADAAVVNLNLTGAQNTGYGMDKLVSIEDVTTGSGDDLLTGNGQANAMNGGFGNDTIVGGGGNDTINGDGGDDRLTGGAGQDVFVFDSELATGSFDRITDFNVADDTIQLENAIFTTLGAGSLAASAFVANASGQATHATDRIIYETDTGNLYYDADGNGFGAAVQFATLASGLALTAADFFVI